MLTTEEEKFIQYWEANRTKKKKTLTQLAIGLPLGLVLSLPILLSLLSGWNKNFKLVKEGETIEKKPMLDSREMLTQFTPDYLLVIIIAVLAIAIFIAIFQQKHKWDLQENQYLSLLQRKTQSHE
jgi:hypothetical protein